MSDQTTNSSLPAVWQSRFGFFEKYGLPSSSPESKVAFRALPFGAKVRIGSNLLAFFFGPIYFAVKGMWRKGLTLLGIELVVSVVLSMLALVLRLPDGAFTGAGVGVAAIGLSTANYAYYLHVTTGSRSWNLFEGFGRQKR